MAALLVLDDIKTITAIPVGSVGAQPGYYYLNLIITDTQGREFEITMSSKDKAVLAKLNKEG